MPGSFSSEYAAPPKLDFVGARSQLFFPPSTPSAVSSLHRSIVSDFTDGESDTGSRKRARYASTTRQSHSRETWSDLSSAQSSTVLSSQIPSPAPLVSTSYLLAGSTHTPTNATIDPIEDPEYSEEADYRPNRFRQSSTSIMDRPSPHTPGPLLREGNGRKRGPTSPRRNDGWGKTMVTMVGGVAGRVIDFCWNNAFRGFYAGGGSGFPMPPTSTHTESRTWEQPSGIDDVFDDQYRASTPIPGRFPDEDYIPEYMSHPAHHETQSASKPGGGDGDGLNGNWVLVRNDPLNSGEGSPTHSTRKVPRPSAHHASRRPPSSRASIRPKLTPSRPSLTSHTGSPALQHTRTASFASPRGSPNGSSPHRSKNTTPRASLTATTSPDVQKFAAKARKKAKEEDVSLSRWNSQLKAMIREGKEALGTKVEILDADSDLEDEGYAEGGS